jgi:hypothetical protein
MCTLAIQAGKFLQRPHIPMLVERNARKGFFERGQFEAVRNRLPATYQALRFQRPFDHGRFHVVVRALAVDVVVVEEVFCGVLEAQAPVSAVSGLPFAPSPSRCFRRLRASSLTVVRALSSWRYPLT